MAGKGVFRILSGVIGGLSISAAVLNSSDAGAEKISKRALLPVDDIWEIEVGSRKIVCGGPVSGKYVSGSIQSVLNGVLFTPASDKVKTLKGQFKKATGAKRTKIKKKLDTLSKAVKSDDGICQNGPDAPPPAATATPTRTPTPVAPQGNFDSNGNVTAAGKIAFGIPASFNANRESGKNIYNSGCKGCHDIENQGRSFSTYKNTIQAAPMFIFDMSDGDLAHLTAYLNRFRTE